MELLASWLVAKPLRILAVAAVLLGAHLACRFAPWGSTRAARPLLVASSAWGLYAAWEWLVQVETPEANIRVDLLVIWPLLALLSAWALVRIMR